MTRRAPFLVRLAYAALRDAAGVTCALAQWFILDPSMCRLVGHDPVPLYDDERTRVAVTCLRCGRKVEGA